MNKFKRYVFAFIKYFLLIILVIFTIYPIYWMFYAATFTPDQLIKFILTLIPGSSLGENFKLLSRGFNIVQVVKNTFIVSIIGTFLNVTVNIMMGYALAKYDFKYKEAVFKVFVVSLFVGGVSVMIPQFQIIMKLGLYNTLAAIVLPGIYSPYLAFLCRQALVDFPDEILQAGRIDGCGEIGMFFKLVVPNIKSVVATVSIISFMGYWNGYLWNLIVTSTVDKYTLQVALASIYPKAGLWFYGPLRMVGVAMSVLPILVIFVFMQRYFINSVQGAIKS